MNVLLLLFFSSIAFGEVTITRLSKSNSQVELSEDIPSNEVIFADSYSNAIGKGRIENCVNRICDLKILRESKNSKVEIGTLVYSKNQVKKTIKRSNSLEFFGETSFGESFGVSYLRRASKKMQFGFTLQRYDDLFAKTEFEGIGYYLQAVYRLWAEKRISVYSDNLIGIMNLTLDFEKVNAATKKTSENSLNLKSLLRLQYELNSSYKAFLSFGGGYNSLSSSISSNGEDYEIDFDGAYGVASIGLRYDF